MGSADLVTLKLPPGKLFLNGKWEDADSSRTIDVVNPATGERLAEVPDGNACDVDRAVAAARANFESRAWRGLDPSKRERILWNIGDLLMKYRDELAAIITMENGKTLPCRVEIAQALRPVERPYRHPAQGGVPVGNFHQLRLYPRRHFRPVRERTSAQSP